MDQEVMKHLVLFWRLGRILEQEPGAGIIEEISGGMGSGLEMSWDGCARGQRRAGVCFFMSVSLKAVLLKT